MASKKGIITLSIVISRQAIKPSIRLGFFMFIRFKAKSKIQFQLEEYIEWKSRFSLYSAKMHNNVVKEFIKFSNLLDVREVKTDHIKKYEKYIINQITQYSFHGRMRAIRCFLRFHRRWLDFNPNYILDDGLDLQKSLEQISIDPMTEIRKQGRPFENKDLALKIYKLRSKGDLTFRQIGTVLDKDVKTIYRLYKKAETIVGIK